MSAMDNFLDRMGDNKEGLAVGVYSLCSAHPDVLKAGLLQALEDNSIALIESTSNQVDQFGGYTGMTPRQFVDFVKGLAREIGFPEERLLLGGDHLGPNAWQHLPAREAMANARELIRSYVEAGYQKIHLDASMFCADDPVDRRKPLPDGVVSSRAAELCAEAESAWAEYRQEHPKPVYIIGTEVPIPGGAREEEKEVTPTAAADVFQTIGMAKEAFKSRGLDEAWRRVAGVVVQPGVEFGDGQVFHYNSAAAGDLKRLIEDTDGMVYETHSTDYQSETGLTALVQDHFCILKVGPWLTFAFREALFALEDMEQELLTGSKRDLSCLKKTLETVMQEEPKYWARYYPGTQAEQRFKQKYSFSDRSRYYWPDRRLTASIQLLKNNLDTAGIPLSLLSQYMPGQYTAVQEGRISIKAGDLIISRIRDVTGIYSRACGFG